MSHIGCVSVLVVELADRGSAINKATPSGFIWMKHNKTLILIILTGKTQRFLYTRKHMTIENTQYFENLGLGEQKSLLKVETCLGINEKSIFQFPNNFKSSRNRKSKKI